MKHLTLRKMDNWIVFRATNSSFVSLIKSGIVPASYRKYDAETQCWCVHVEKIREIVDLASRYYEVDWSNLPASWQGMITGEEPRRRAKSRRKTSVKNSPYSKLFLLDTAPRSLVKAAYQALLIEYHPDHNDGEGDQVKLNEVINAYRKIINNFDD